MLYFIDLVEKWLKCFKNGRFIYFRKQLILASFHVFVSEPERGMRIYVLRMRTLLLPQQ